MLHFTEMIFGVLNYASFGFCADYSNYRGPVEKSPTFENVYADLTWKHTTKISEYSAATSSDKFTNFLIFPNKKNISNKNNNENSSTDTYNVIFATNKKTENFDSYSIINQPELMDFYGKVLVQQDFYKSLNTSTGNGEVITDYKPYLLQQHFVIDGVKYSVGENTADFLNMIFLKSQNKERSSNGFDSTLIKNNLNQYVIINISSIHSNVKLDKFVFYVQFNNGFSSCFASELETKDGVLNGKITKISNIGNWTECVPHTKNSKIVAVIMTFCSIIVSGALLIFGVFKGIETNKRFNSEEEQNARERYAEELNQSRNNNVNNAPVENVILL